MPNESFLQRWSRLKAAPEAPAHAAHAAHALPTAGAARAEADIEPETAPATPLPTLADAAMLDAGSDYSAFVARGVDADVRRQALKKLFADPHFNRIDGLDIYMGDYTVASPVSPAMLASLSHARSVFARIDELLDPAAAAGTTGTTDAPALPSPHQEAG